MDYNFVFNRRHPRYLCNRTTWQRSRAAYSGGADYISQALVKHVSEIELEFNERLFRAFYINYPRKIARLITQYVLSVEPQRENAEPEIAEDFSRTGLRVGEVMRQFSTLLNIYGSAAILVDMPFFAGTVDRERKQRERLRPFARALSPLEVADWAYGADGLLDWAIVEEDDWCDKGAFHAPEQLKRRRLWTRKEFFVLEKFRNSGAVTLAAHGKNPLGVVPLVFTDEPDGFGLDANHYFEDIVRISDAILNNGSEAQMNIVKQMFGLLVISDSFARGARPDAAATENGDRRFSHILARSAAIWESPEERGISRYIAPSGADTATIRDENAMLKKELFDAVGMALQPDSRQTQSAESKSWDNHQVRQFLAGRADLLEQSEMQTWRMMHMYDCSIPVPQVVYNRDFSVVDLKKSIESLLDLSKLAGGEAYNREITRTAIFLMEKIKQISPENKKKILAQLENADV